VAGVRRSGRQHQPANRNKEYQCTLDEEAERQANLREHDAQPQNPEPEPASDAPEHAPEPSEGEPQIPGAFAASLENIEDFIFAGSANSNSDESLPRTLKEAYSGPEEELWK
ncbi:hypothetical protein BDN67DRAFT_871816, partial [Paxillus ammoniavirescens]